MPGRGWRLRLEDVLDSIHRIRAHTAGMDLDAFVSDRKTADAVQFLLLVIGETARQMPDEIVVRHPEVPWAEMRESAT